MLATAKSTAGSTRSVQSLAVSLGSSRAARGRADCWKRKALPLCHTSPPREKGISAFREPLVRGPTVRIEVEVEVEVDKDCVCICLPLALFASANRLLRNNLFHTLCVKVCMKSFD